ncbi:MAG: ABC transporter ATP-binding protein [Chlamydiota bacterium]
MTPLLQVRHLKKYFFYKGNPFKVVDDICFSIESNQILGLVGESGSGKSTLAKTILQLYKPTSGDVLLEGVDLSSLSTKALKVYRKHFQMIFQDSTSSLNPRMTILEIIKEPLLIHKIYSNKKRVEQRVLELLELVGMQSYHANAFPHELSGGQRQRVGIARALSLNPKLLICDEPIAALDISIQAQIINLLKTLQQQLGLTYLFISHDLAMVKYLCTHVAVMYLGVFVEMAEVKDLYKRAAHPYTQALLSSIAIPDPLIEKTRSRIIMPGDIPQPSTELKGCVFCSRCPKAMDICKIKAPLPKEIAPNHTVRCHLY